MRLTGLWWEQSLCTPVPIPLTGTSGAGAQRDWERGDKGGKWRHGSRDCAGPGPLV